MIFLGYFQSMRLCNRKQGMKNLYLCTLKTSTSSRTSSSVVLMSFGKTITFWTVPRSKVQRAESEVKL